MNANCLTNTQHFIKQVSKLSQMVMTAAINDQTWCELKTACNQSAMVPNDTSEQHEVCVPQRSEVMKNADGA